MKVYQPAFALTVATAGTGQGFVDSAPVGIDCGTFGTHTDCTENYTSGQMVTLTANASVGSTFTSFSGGGCAGPSQCVVTMDQARSVTATFTLNAVATTYSAEVLADTPAGYWRFGEASGTTLTDSSGNANHGTYVGGVTLGAAGALVGDPNTAATYDGVNDYGTVPDSASLHVGTSFSLEGWIKRSSTSKSHQMVVRGNGFQLVVMNAGSGNQVWLRKANVTTLACSSGGISDGAYHHVVATINGPSSTAKIYIDGVDQTVIVSAPQSIPDTPFPIVFGIAKRARSSTSFALYPDVLSQARVTAHYDAGT